MSGGQMKLAPAGPLPARLLEPLRAHVIGRQMEQHALLDCEMLPGEIDELCQQALRLPLVFCREQLGDQATQPVMFAPHGLEDVIHGFLVGGKKVEKQLVLEHTVGRQQILQQCRCLLKLAEAPTGLKLFDVGEDGFQSSVFAEQRINQVHLSAISAS